MKHLDYKQLEFGYQKIQNCEKTFKFAQHLHNTWEIYFLKSDKVLYTIDATTFHLKTNDLLIIPPHCVHLVSAKAQSDYKRFTVNFSANKLPPSIQKLLTKLDFHYHIPINSSVFLLFDEILNYSDNMSQEELYDAVKILIGLTVVELYYDKKYSIVSAKSVDQLLSDILTYIKNNITKPLTIDALCKNFFISRSKLAHLFSSKLNVGIMQFINFQKIMYAQQLISNGMPPTVASFTVGYENYSTFYRQYKKLLFHSPEEDKEK